MKMMKKPATRKLSNFVFVLALLELARKGSAKGIWPDVPEIPCFAVISPPNFMSGVSKAQEAVEDSGEAWAFRSNYIGPLLTVNRCIDSTHPYIKFALTNHNYSDVMWMQPAYSAFGCLAVTEENGFQIQCTQGRNNILWTCLDITISCTKEFGTLGRRVYLKVELLTNTRAARTYSECIYVKPKIIETSKVLDLLGIEVGLIDPNDVDCGPYYIYGVLLGSFVGTFFVCACAPLSSEDHTEIVFEYLSTDEEEEISRKRKMRQAILDRKAAAHDKLAAGLKRAREGKVDSSDYDDYDVYYTDEEYEKGSNTKGSNTKGSTTKGSTTKGSYTNTASSS